MSAGDLAFVLLNGVKRLSTRNSIGGLLRTLGAKSDAGNATTRPPWSRPATMTVGETVAAGEFRVTPERRVYYAQFGGTVSVIPAQEYPAGLAADGTLIWVFVGSISIDADDALAPTVSTGGLSNINAVLPKTNNYYPASQPQFFTVLDAPAVNSVFGAAQPTGWDDGNGGKTQAGGAIAFETEAPGIAISYVYNTAGFRIKIDGRWRTIQPEPILTVQTGSNNFNYTYLAFPDGIKTRRIVIDTSGRGGTTPQSQIYGVHVNQNHQVRPIKVDSTMAVIADSWGAGAGYQYMFGARWPQQLRDLLGFDEVLNYSIGGTSYSNKGPGSAYYTFVERIPVLLADLKARGKSLPKLWIFAGSGNGNGSPSAEGAGLTAAIAAIRAVDLTVPVVVFGVQPWNDASATFSLTTTSGDVNATITAISSGSVSAGQKITSAGLPAGTTIQSLGTSTGGTGTIVLSQPASAAQTSQPAYANAGVLISANEAAQLSAITTLSDSSVFYVPCYGDPKGPWLAGTWNNGATPGTGRATLVNSGWLLGNDKTHSYDIGYTYWAARMASEIRSKVYPVM